MRWSYKTVHYALKKEGFLGSAFLDESEIEMSLNEYGKAGWELVSLLETLDGLTAVFKQPLSLGGESVLSAAPPASKESGKGQPVYQSIAKGSEISKKEKIQTKTSAGAASDYGEPLEEVVLLHEEGEVQETVAAEQNDPPLKEAVRSKKKVREVKEDGDVGSIRIE